MRFHLPFKFRKRSGQKKVFSLRLTKKVIALYAILFTAFFVCLAIFVTGGGLSESQTFTLSFITPTEGETFTDGNVYISGDAIGGVIKNVVVWDQKYNVGMPANIGINLWNINIPVNLFSKGTHVICVKAESTDGRWSPVICRTINTNPTTYKEATGYIADTLPAGFGMIFKPAEVVGRSVVVLVSGGTASDDQNGDNIPDQFQQSPVSPNYNPSNVPILMSLVFVAIIVLLIVSIFGVKEYLSRREERIKTVQTSPEYWKLQESKLRFARTKINAKELWLNNEIKKRESDLRHSELSRKAVEQRNRELEALLAEQRLFNNQKAKLNLERKQGKEVKVTKHEFEKAASALGIRPKGKSLDVTKDQYLQIKNILEKKRSFEEMEKNV